MAGGSGPGAFESGTLYTDDGGEFTPPSQWFGKAVGSPRTARTTYTAGGGAVVVFAQPPFVLESDAASVAAAKSHVVMLQGGNVKVFTLPGFVTAARWLPEGLFATSWSSIGGKGTLSLTDVERGIVLYSVDDTQASCVFSWILEDIVPSDGGTYAVLGKNATVPGERSCGVVVKHVGGTWAPQPVDVSTQDFSFCALGGPGGAVVATKRSGDSCVSQGLPATFPVVRRLGGSAVFPGEAAFAVFGAPSDPTASVGPVGVFDGGAVRPVGNAPANCETTMDPWVWSLAPVRLAGGVVQPIEGATPASCVGGSVVEFRKPTADGFANVVEKTFCPDPTPNAPRDPELPGFGSTYASFTGADLSFVTLVKDAAGAVHLSVKEEIVPSM